MPWIAFTSLVVFLLAAFPLRSLLGRRRFGSFASPGLRAPRPASWWVANVLFVSGFASLLAGAALHGAGAVDALAASEGALAASGILLLVLATILLVWSQETMGRAWRPAIPPADQGDLVTAGPFRLVRNPNYVAMLGAGLGAILLAANAVTIAGWIVLLASLLLTARAEEPRLLDRYAEAYADYAARTGRFIPGVGRLR